MTINLLLILLLAVLHLSVSSWRWPKEIAVLPWQEVAGGIAIAYVFLDLLPTLANVQITFPKSNLWSTQGGYFLSLLGLLLVYSLKAQMRPGVLFNASMTTQAIYNLLFSYLLSHTARILDCLLLFIAVGLHYWVNDHSLAEHFPKRYRHYGRWILAIALFLGWGLAQAVLVLQGVNSQGQGIAIAAIQAFLAGSIILNVLTQELPEARRGKVFPFTAGALGYAAVLMLV